MRQTKIKGFLGYTLFMVHFIGMWILRLLVGKYLAEKNTRELNWIRIIIGSILISFIILLIVALIQKTFFNNPFNHFFNLKYVLIYTIIGTGVSSGLKWAKDKLVNEFPDVID